MSSTVTAKTSSDKDFDYSTLDTETSNFVQAQTGEIRALMKRTAQDIIDIGQKLIEIKQRLGYGQYRKWIKTEFNWGKSTANSFENVAKQFADVHNLDIFAPSALYELAAPSTPKSAREEAIVRAQSGEIISYKYAKEIKKKHVTKLAKSKPQSVGQPSASSDLQLEQNNHEPQSDNDYYLSIVDTSKLVPTTKSQQISQQKLMKYEAQKSVVNSNASVVADLQTIQPESWWQLGKNHLMYCGNPHSPKLYNQLPKRLALAISFPPTANWNLGRLEEKVNSSLILFSQYDDVDLKSLEEIVRNALELYTSDQETVLFSFLPNPALFLLAETLFCCCLIAEPDLKRCQAVIKAWTHSGGKVKLLTTLMNHDWRC